MTSRLLGAIAALAERLDSGPLTIAMSDYGGFEKVGDLDSPLPTNDERITTEAGDLLLYQGRSFVIYYDTNTWSLTRLGRVEVPPPNNCATSSGPAMSR